MKSFFARTFVYRTLATYLMLGCGLILTVLLQLLYVHAASAQDTLPDDFSCGEVTYVPVSECQALVDLYNATGGSAWREDYRDSWFTPLTRDKSGPCGWLGVTCEFGHVVELAITPWMHDDTGEMSGHLPNGIFSRLPYLHRLSLGGNDLSGPLPADISDLSYLKILHLERNRLSGPIPEGLLGHKAIPEISKYAHLNSRPVIDLRENDFSGELPNDLGSDTVNNLQLNDLPQLRGPIPLSYAGQVLRFSWLNTALCVPSEEDILFWLVQPDVIWTDGGIPSQLRECPTIKLHPVPDPNPGPDPVACVEVDGKPLTAPVDLDTHTRIDCSPDCEECVAVHVECTGGHWVLATLYQAGFLIGTLPGDEDFEDDEIVPEPPKTNALDVNTAFVMGIIDPSDELLDQMCNDAPVETGAISVPAEALRFEAVSGSGDFEVHDATNPVEISMPNALVTVTEAADVGVVLVDDYGEYITVQKGAATVTPAGGSEAYPLVKDKGLLLTSDGSAYRYTIPSTQFSQFLPMITSD